METETGLSKKRVRWATEHHPSSRVGPDGDGGFYTRRTCRDSSLLSNGQHTIVLTLTARSAHNEVSNCVCIRE